MSLLIDHISMAYGNTQVLKDISAEIQRGEFLSILGHSGCGKTTLTRLMNGLAPSYFKGSISGSICIDDRDLSLIHI